MNLHWEFYKMTCKEAIQEVFETENGELSTGEVVSKIYERHPDQPWKRSTISAHLIGLSINHSSSHHYPSMRRHAFLWSLGNGRFRRWNRETDQVHEDATSPAFSRIDEDIKTSEHRPYDQPRSLEKQSRTIRDIFEITNFIDNSRWHTATNYNLINFYKEDLSNDTRLLTHWLCYITDRQMEFERIWDIGGFIFSDLVDQIKATKSLQLLNPQTPSSFFVKRRDYLYKDQFKFKKENYEKYLFVSHQKVSNNSILLEYEFKEHTSPFFISRYYPSDYLSILYTLTILQDYDFNLTRYIIRLLNFLRKDDQLISKVLFGLYLLSYEGIGQPNHSDIKFGQNMEAAEKRKRRIEKILSTIKLFDKEFKTFKEEAIYKQKRAWCSWRDFLKSPEFSGYFFSSLSENGFGSIAEIKSPSMLSQLELPGDVWNNNPKFRKCILKGTIYETSPLSFAKLLRTIYEREHIEVGYPEQFDITFDFVPRMCEKHNCSLCVYNKNRGDGNSFGKICVKDVSKYCSVVLINCNYIIECKGQDCELLQIK